MDIVAGNVSEFDPLDRRLKILNLKSLRNMSTDSRDYLLFT